jgi:hypothetical protein
MVLRENEPSFGTSKQVCKITFTKILSFLQFTAI